MLPPLLLEGGDFIDDFLLLLAQLLERLHDFLLLVLLGLRLRLLGGHSEF